MRFNLRNYQYVAAAGRTAIVPAIPDDVYDFTAGSGSVYNRFSGGTATPNPTAYTISAWVRPGSGLTQSLVCRTDTNTFSSWSHALHQGGTSYWQAYIFDLGPKAVNATTAPVLNVWTHVVVTAANGGFMRIYVNGVSEGTPVGISAMWTGGFSWVIAQGNGTAGAGFQGMLADVALWNIELTAGEVASLGTGVRNLPLAMHPGNLILYCPMNDVADGVAVSSDWAESVGGLTQTRTGTPYGKRIDLP